MLANKHVLYLLCIVMPFWGTWYCVNNTESWDALAQGSVSPSQRSLTIWRCIYCNYDVCTNRGLSALVGLWFPPTLGDCVGEAEWSCWIDPLNCKPELSFISPPGYPLHMQYEIKSKYIAFIYTLQYHSHDFIFSLLYCVCWPFTTHILIANFSISIVRKKVIHNVFCFL